jgi:hypothetical protein
VEGQRVRRSIIRTNRILGRTLGRRELRRKAREGAEKDGQNREREKRRDRERNRMRRSIESIERRREPTAERLANWNGKQDRERVE